MISATNSVEQYVFERIEYAISQISWLGQRQWMQLLASERFDLTVPQYYTLLHLGRCDGECKMSDLARLSQQSAAALTGVVDRLLEKQLVARGRPSSDRRQVVVSITERGRGLLEEVQLARRDQMDPTLAQIEPFEAAALLGLLDTLLAAMLRSSGPGASEEARVETGGG